MKKIIFVLFVLSNYSLVFTQTCPIDITFTSQSQIDSFPVLYPNCSQIEGDLEIGKFPGDDIVDLDSLYNITSIGGSLTIKYNPLLENLNGLIHLTSVGNSLSFTKNNLLEDFSGLNNLVYIPGNLEIWLCQKLQNLNGLESLTEVHDDLVIYGNQSLKDLTGLNRLKKVGDFWIEGQDSLVSFSGLDSLEYVGRELDIDGNNAIVNLAGFDVLSYVRILSISDNKNLIEFTGLSKLKSVETLNIHHQDSIKNLSGLETLTSITNSLEIDNCSGLKSLEGLNSLDSIPVFDLTENDSLNDLLALSNVTYMRSLKIAYNNELDNLNGLENIHAKDLNQVRLIDNPKLSKCAIYNLCRFLEVQSATIRGNAFGCNSEEEVSEACSLNDIEDIIHESKVEIYPNPCRDQFSVKLDRINEEFTIEIKNSVGMTVYSEQARNTESIDISVSEFSNGYYSLLLHYPDSIEIYKFVKY